MKPVVTYKEAFQKVVVGQTATITGRGAHPLLGGGGEDFITITSIVVALREDGFETLNTIYTKV